MEGLGKRLTDSQTAVYLVSMRKDTKRKVAMENFIF